MIQAAGNLMAVPFMAFLQRITLPPARVTRNVFLLQAPRRRRFLLSGAAAEEEDRRQDDRGQNRAAEEGRPERLAEERVRTRHGLFHSPLRQTVQGPLELSDLRFNLHEDE